MIKLPTTGINPSKVKFYDEVSTAFKFLALYYSLNQEQQQELLDLALKLAATKQDG